MRVLFLGRNTGTSLQRRQAMERLGIDVTAIDLLHTLPNMRIVGSIIHHAGAIGINRLVTRQVTRAIRGERFDLVWVEKGEVVSPRLVSELKKCAGYVLLYNVDDPFGPRERSLWRQVHLALPFYDGIVVVRSENVEEAFDRGARRVLRVFRSADEVAHQPRRLTA